MHLYCSAFHSVITVLLRLYKGLLLLGSCWAVSQGGQRRVRQTQGGQRRGRQEAGWPEEGETGSIMTGQHLSIPTGL